MSIKGSYSDPDLFVKLANYRMPFGKHSKSLLIDLPDTYLNWFNKKGFPKGELGQLMRVVHESKVNDMQHFIDGIRSKYQHHDSNSPQNAQIKQ